MSVKTTETNMAAKIVKQQTIKGDVRGNHVGCSGFTEARVSLYWYEEKRVLWALDAKVWNISLFIASHISVALALHVGLKSNILSAADS